MGWEGVNVLRIREKYITDKPSIEQTFSTPVVVYDFVWAHEEIFWNMSYQTMLERLLVNTDNTWFVCLAVYILTCDRYRKFIFSAV